MGILLVVSCIIYMTALVRRSFVSFVKRRMDHLHHQTLHDKTSYKTVLSQHTLHHRAFVQLWICVAWNEAVLWLYEWLTMIHQFHGITIRYFFNLLVILWCLCWENTLCSLFFFKEGPVLSNCSPCGILLILKEM